MRDQLVGYVVLTIAGACRFAPDGATIGGDAALADAVDAFIADAHQCFDGFTRVCLAARPTTPLVLTGSMTIDAGTAACAATTLGTAANVCVIAATTIDVNFGATLRASGNRPIVLLATGSITIAGLLDVASHIGGTAGAGGSVGICGLGVAPTLANGSAGGGWGGTFATLGGDGGDSTGRGVRGFAPTTPIVPTTLRGGCTGGTGGGLEPGSGAPAGGAIELNAGTISVTGTIDASGAGAASGASGDSGGGGAGTGGMIVFSTTQLVLGTGAAVFAQGGGGGGGAAGSFAGSPGFDATTAGIAAMSGPGYTASGGTGGMGGVGSLAGNGSSAQAGNLIGGGGGGGGAGVIKVVGATSPTGGVVVPPFS